jgi:RHS repeat-associated protein
VTLIGTNPGGAVDIVQTNNCYPFGLVMSQTNGNKSPSCRENRYLYNNKEIQSDNMTGEAMNWYDHGARFYDPQIGKWNVVDPIA